MKIVIWILALMTVTGVQAAELFEVKLSTEIPIPQSRAALENRFSGAKHPLSSLEQVRLAIFDRNWKACTQYSARARSQHPLIQDWITLNEIRCYLQMSELSVEETKNVLAAVRRVLSKPEWLLSSSAAKDLRQAVLEARFKLVEATTKRNPKEAWDRVEDLLEHLEWMDIDQQANALKMAGELAFVRQRLTASKRFLERSLELKEDEKVRSRLTAVETVLRSGGAKVEPPKPPADLRDEALEASEKERETVDRMRVALKSGNLLAATEDAIVLIQDYPWGARATWAADRIWDSYSQIVQKNDQNFLNLRGKILKQMLKADSKRLFDWGTQAFRISQFSDALQLVEQSLKKSDEQFNTTAIRLLAARSAQALGLEKEARHHYMVLVGRHAGTIESKQALFQVGLLSYRLKENTVAAASFERLLVLPGTEDMELDSRYWLWRSLLEIDQSRAKLEAAVIIKKFPFSYYGLRVRAESNGGQLDLALTQTTNKIQSSLWLTAAERKSWLRFEELSRGGWYQEAQVELEKIPQPKDPASMALMARAWSASFGFSKAIGLMGKAWDQDDRLRGKPFFPMIFPLEFSKLILNEAKQNKLDANWIRGLIRQESAFNFVARSRSNALGLMQMIPPTADEVAADLKWKNLKLPEDLWDPATNLKFCSYYLAKILNKFGGHLPLALASYNAGPSRIGDWYQSRGIQMSLTSDPRQEVWMDELPWNEPRFYVKAILRNVILYRALDRGPVQFADPIWKADL